MASSMKLTRCSIWPFNLIIARSQNQKAHKNALKMSQRKCRQFCSGFDTGSRGAFCFQDFWLSLASKGKKLSATTSN